MKLTSELMIALFHKHKEPRGKQAKLKSPNQLQELLDVTRALLQVRRGVGGWITCLSKGANAGWRKLNSQPAVGAAETAGTQLRCCSRRCQCSGSRQAKWQEAGAACLPAWKGRFSVMFRCGLEMQSSWTSALLQTQYLPLTQLVTLVGYHLNAWVEGFIEA